MKTFPRSWLLQFKLVRGKWHLMPTGRKAVTPLVYNSIPTIPALNYSPPVDVQYVWFILLRYYVGSGTSHQATERTTEPEASLRKLITGRMSIQIMFPLNAVCPVIKHSIQVDIFPLT